MKFGFFRNFFFLFAALVLLDGCRPPKPAHSNPKEKSFEHFFDVRKEVAMPESLEEISGMTFLPQQDQFLYAIQDEDGILYKYDVNEDKIVQEFVFGKKGDYEDVTTNGTFFFVLRSDGNVYSFSTALNEGEASIRQKKVVDKGEYESIAYQPKDNRLYILCKECAVDKNMQQTTGYVFDIQQDGYLSEVGSFHISQEMLKAAGAKVHGVFRPSAMSFSVAENVWYILSSKEGLLIKMNEDLTKILDVYPFRRKQFEQPEGLAFDSQNRFYLSSEAGNRPAGMLYLLSQKR